MKSLSKQEKADRIKEIRRKYLDICKGEEFRIPDDEWDNIMDIVGNDVENIADTNMNDLDKINYIIRSLNEMGTLEIVIMSKYFPTIKEYAKVPLLSKKYENVLECLKENELPLNNEKEFELLKSIDTYNVTKPEAFEEFLEMLKIVKDKVPKRVNFRAPLTEEEYKNFQKRMVVEDKIIEVGKELSDNKFDKGNPMYTTERVMMYNYRNEGGEEKKIEIGRIEHEIEKVRNENEIDKYTTVLKKSEIKKSKVDLSCTELKELGFAAFSEGLIEYDEVVNVLENSLKEIVLPYSIEKIEPYCFYKCSELSSVKYVNEKGELKEGIPDRVKEIGYKSFFECTSLQEIEIKVNMEVRINEESFCRAGISKLEIEGRKVVIGDESFQKCNRLKEIKIEGHIEYLGNRAFYDNKELENVELPEGLKRIEEEVFFKCTSLEKIEIPDSVSSIGCSCFMNCNSLKEVELPKDIDYIPWRCFKGCSSLKEIEIPNKVKSLGIESFANCSSLESIKIPISVEISTRDCFENCHKLKEVIFVIGEYKGDIKTKKDELLKSMGI